MNKWHDKDPLNPEELQAVRESMSWLEDRRKTIDEIHTLKKGTGLILKLGGALLAGIAIVTSLQTWGVL